MNIPKNWYWVKIGDNFIFKNGLNKEKSFFGKGTPIINILDVFNNSGLTSKQIKGKVTLSSDEIRTFGVRKGDVLFARTSETIEEIGMSSVVLEELENTVFSGFLLRGRQITQNFDLDFKKYCFHSSIARKQIISLASKTTRALTNGRLLSKVVIPIPKDLKEQNSISVAISDIEELILQLQTLIEKKKNVKKGTMQELLTGKRRLEGFGDEWTERKISELGNVVTGSTPSTYVKSYWNGNIPWVTPTDILHMKNISTTERMITSEGLNSIRIIPENSLLVTCVASIGKNVILRKRGSCNQQINAIIPNSQNNVDFLYYFFENSKNFLIANSAITTTRIITKYNFSNITFSMPKVEEQEAIAQILSDMDSEIEHLEKKKEKYKMIKHGMMQKLLTGEIRLE